MALVKQVILSHRRLKTKELAAQSYSTLHDYLDMSKSSVRFMLRILSAVQNKRRVECFETEDVFGTLSRESARSFKSVVMGDETTVLSHDLLSERILWKE